MNLYPFLFEPNKFTLVWGSEDWDISAIPNKESIIANGPLKGKKLSQVVDDYAKRLMGRKVVEMYGKKFPLLVKFIDAKDDLSIQVHPDDAYAYEYENGEHGKTEMWYVLDAKKDAELVYGFSQTTNWQ